MPNQDMKIVVVGAAGRMGQTLIRAVAETEGVVLSGAVEREGSDAIGKDAGEIAGLGGNGGTISADPLPAFVEADGVLDFTIPAASVEFSTLAAQARIVHVIGTTGCTDDDEAKFLAAARQARIVKSGALVIVFSDFDGWDAETEKNLRTIAQHNELILFSVLDPTSEQLPPDMDIVVSDGTLQAQINIGDETVRRKLADFSTGPETVKPQGDD